MGIISIITILIINIVGSWFVESNRIGVGFSIIVECVASERFEYCC